MTNSHNDQIENWGKVGYGKSVGYIPPKDEFHRIYPVFLEFADQMENLSKDDIWELSVLATCGWIRRNYHVFLEFIEKKIENRVKDWIWQLGIYFIWRINSQILSRFFKFTGKKGKFWVKIAYGNFGYYSLWMLRIYLVFLKFTDQMENRGEDGLRELKVLATCGPNSQNSYRFSRIHWKKMENRVKDWFWHPRIYSTWRTNYQNLPRFSKIH